MFIHCFDSMLNQKYHNSVVYCHNLAKFDFAFIRNILFSKYNPSKIISKDTNIISFKFNNNLKGTKKVSITFRDSLALLPFSLAKLGPPRGGGGSPQVKDMKLKLQKVYFLIDLLIKII